MNILEALGLRRKATKLYPNDLRNTSSFKIITEQPTKVPEPTTATLEAGFFWEIPDVPFRNIYSYIKKDPGLQSAWNTYRNYIIGAGFHVTSEDDRAKQVIEEWQKQVKFETKLFNIIGDRLALGVSLVEPLKNGNDLFDISIVDMRTIVAAQRDKFGKTTHYVHQSNVAQQKLLEAKNYWEFRLIDVGRQAWPIGLFHSLITPFMIYENQDWSRSDAISFITAMIISIYQKMGAPRVWHKYENTSEEFLKSQALRDKDMKPGERGYTNKAFEILREDFDTQTRFREGLEWISNQYENGIQAPTAKIMTAAGLSNATYASAKAAEEMFGQSLEGLKRKMKVEIEELIYKPLLAQNGIDITESKTEFNWGLQDQPEIDINSIISLKNSGIISDEEARKIASDMGIPLDLSQPIIPVAQTQQQTEETMKRMKRLEKQISVLTKKEKLYESIARRYKL